METKKMTKIFVAYMMGNAPTWLEGRRVTFVVTFRNTNSTWEMTLSKEGWEYPSASFHLKGQQLTFEGRKPEYPQTWNRRYKTMEKAFLHILNHFNENSNIRDKYNSVQQWFDEEQKPCYI